MQLNQEGLERERVKQRMKTRMQQEKERLASDMKNKIKVNREMLKVCGCKIAAESPQYCLLSSSRVVSVAELDFWSSSK